MRLIDKVTQWAALIGGLAIAAAFLGYMIWGLFKFAPNVCP